MHTFALYSEPSILRRLTPLNIIFLDIWQPRERSSSTTGALIFDIASEEEKLVRLLYAV